MPDGFDLFGDPVVVEKTAPPLRHGSAGDVRLRVLSLGAGVQSTRLALGAARGEIGPMPDCAIFADTGWEPAAVYRHLDWLETQLPFPVYRVTVGNLRDRIGAPRPAGKFLVVDIPAFVRGDNGKAGGQITRSCTRDYKIRPIVKKVRELVGLTGKPGPKHVIVEQWIGISTDEAVRMKPSQVDWIQHRWPLIEELESRKDCLAWMEANGYPRPGKSSCIGCPFHGDDEWQALTPDEFEDACRVDERLRSLPPEKFRLKGVLYLHRSCKPLREVDFAKREGRQHSMFGNECEGMCGV
jgi:hypothetical protein